MNEPGVHKRVLIIVENLPVPFDRRVWQEATALHSAGYLVSIICPAVAGYDARYEEIEGIAIYRHPLPVEADSLAGLLDWMLENLDTELTVPELARRALMSERTFARRFRAETGTTPAAWVARQRLLRAQELLEGSTLSVDEVAARSGFGTAAVLRHHFTRSLATTPLAYRRRFHTPQSQVAVPAGTNR